MDFTVSLSLNRKIFPLHGSWFRNLMSFFNLRGVYAPPLRPESRDGAQCIFGLDVKAT